MDAVRVNIDSPAVDRREVEIRLLRRYHWLMLSASLIVLAAAFILRSSSSDGLRIRGFNHALPTTCPSRLLLGLECPGCGLTRSFVALAAGDIAGSLHYNRVGWLIALAVVVQIPYRLYALYELRRRVVHRPWLAWFGYGLLASLVVNWLLRIAQI
jgi:hypothetical protein